MSQIDPKYREQMNQIARSLDEAFNGPARGEERKTGFVLLVFPFGVVDNARTNYISNGPREDIVVLLKEMVARFEGQAEVSGRA
jgi:hypothetical protein